MRLNGRQLLVLKFCIVAMLANIIFPPWSYTLDARSIKSEKPAGYYLIFEPPHPERSKPMYGVKIDLSRLLLQVFAVFLVGAFGIIGLKPGKQKPGEDKAAPKTGDPWTD